MTKTDFDKCEIFVRVFSFIYGGVKIGNPLDESTLMGPLIDQGAVDDYVDALEKAKQEGGEILCGGEVVEGEGFYVLLTITLCVSKC